MGETGEPYGFDGNDPLNEIDPLGLSGGTQGYVNYLRSSRRHRRYCASHEGIRGHSCGGLLHEIRGTLDKQRHYVAAHKKVEIAGAGVVLGTVALAIPGAEGAGAELDEASIASLAGGSDLAPSAGLQAVKAIAGGGAALIDSEDCVKGSAVACGGAILGGAGTIQPEDYADAFVGWGIDVYRYATAH